MSDIDEELRKRLENLRADRVSSSGPSTSRALPKPVKKSAAEQVEDLLLELCGVAELENKENSYAEDVDSQLRNRLERLKSREDCDFAIPSRPKESPQRDELTDEEYFNKSSCSDLLADLEKNSDHDSVADSSDSDILCTVCDEKKPSLICIDCHKDYFCDRCFKEYHSDEEDHKTVPYAKKK